MDCPNCGRSSHFHETVVFHVGPHGACGACGWSAPLESEE